MSFGSEQSKAARCELQHANRALDGALRGRDWAARALREAGDRIRNDAVISIFGRVVLHHDRVVTPSGTFVLCREVTAAVELVPVAPSGKGLALVLAAPSGGHLEPCRDDDYGKARVFASRITSAARTLEFDLDPATRLGDLAARYASLDEPDSPVRRALADLRAVERRLREGDLLPRRYRARSDPPPPPALAWERASGALPVAVTAR